MSSFKGLFKAGQTVYFYHPQDSWIVGVIESVDPNNKKGAYLVKPNPSLNSDPISNENPLLLDEDLLFPYSDDLQKLDHNDLLAMSELHEVTLLTCLRNRFKKDVIYTMIGGVLAVAMNPFKWTIPYVQDDKMDLYINQSKTVMPHAWSIADNAYRIMTETKQNQSILISGESGAGKTEGCKTVIKYLSKLSCSITNDEKIRERASKIALKIQECSPILESFGNAKTQRNDNSSRFGKFIIMQFDKDGVILGAFMYNYLLEKSRVISQSTGERGYHIFYQLLAGCDAKKKQELFLTKPEDYACINGGKCFKVDGVDDAKEFQEVVKAMNIVGLSQEEQDSIFRIVAAVLNLQNLKFKPKGDASEIENRTVLNNASSLLKLEAASLEKALTSMYVTAGKDLILKGLSPAKACDARDAFSKALYDATFNWIIRKINQNLDASKDHKVDNFIGLLDIYGFEAFQKNSFEQLCINYANEALQGVYNNYTFKRDVEECKQEGIDATAVTFNDNVECIELIQKGVVNSITDCCKSNSTDFDFLDNIKKLYFKKSKFFDASPLKKEEFILKHYAGDVAYDVNGWIEKNKDTLNNDLFKLTKTSKCSFISALLEDNGSAKDTVAESFRKQLNVLLSTINSTRPHYIRCIKPHPAKKPNMFSTTEVMNQLRSSGVLETVKIRREGYSVRMPFDQFYHRFKVIHLQSSSRKDCKTIDEMKKACEEIIAQVGFDKVKAQIGNTKVFMRHYAYSDLEVIRGQKLIQYATIIQSSLRSLKSKRELTHLKNLKRQEEERIYYEKHKEEIERKRREEEERMRIERERIEREEAERKRLEEIKRQEEERIAREKREREELIMREQIKLNKLKEIQMKKIEELKRIEAEKEERERIKRELAHFENGKTLAEEPTSVRIWRVDDGKIVGFSLSEARKDLLYRIRTDQLYTLEECKILIKEVVRVMKNDAERDFKNLLFLSKFRTEVLYPKPIVSNYIPESHGLDGFFDSPEIKKLIYGKVVIKAIDPSNTKESILVAKEKLKLLVLNINKNIVKLIDHALIQRKERLLIIATILEELETSSIKKYLHPNELLVVMQKIKQQQHQQ
ncbi:hypothetical protein C9374_011327 [Naegleria lovaniensis]|uniref:Myosin motor domain-containing protein n=1 Tax=Naegleria lovaniensis TaxID=51637 RepID=A0AA88KQR7_NAELO|nr:uncharacterized protein C9374_011327 [Naegleria lovaniensis]KAG2392602.1 hypothetical protein C9374_011327 [Naegleria lovaniensis]